MQTEGKIKHLNKKYTRINSRSNEDLRAFVRVPVLLSKVPKTQTQRRFLALVKHYIINLEFWNFPFCWNKFPTRARTNCNSVHLTFVYVSAILNFVSAIRSETYLLLPARFLLPVFIDKANSLITVKPTLVLVASYGFGILRNTRQAEHYSTTTGQAKLVGIESGL